MAGQGTAPSNAAPRFVGRHYPELDGLRALAVCPVVLFHCRAIATPETPGESLYYKFVETGWVGVDLFFVLSGFLITGILLDTRNDKGYFRNFYIRRALRVFPLYFGTLIFVPAIFFLIDLDRSLDVPDLAYWLFLQNWLPLFSIEMDLRLGHFWSLGVEEQFYLIWPTLILVTARRNWVAQTCLGLIFVTIAVRLWLVLLGNHQGAYFATISRLDGLAVGALLAFLVHRYGALDRYRKAAGIMAQVAVAAIVLLTIAGRGFYGHDRLVVLHGFSLVALSFAGLLVLSLTARPDCALRMLLRSNALCFLGRISYGIYIFHLPLLVGLKSVWPTGGGFWFDQLAFFPVVMASSLLLAALSYRFFEKPILDLKIRLAPIGFDNAPAKSCRSRARRVALDRTIGEMTRRADRKDGDQNSRAVG